MVLRGSPSSVQPRPHADWTDEELVQALGRDDEAAFRAVYERYWYSLFQLAHRKLGTREEAEELIQELFASLWHKRASARIEQLGAYLRTAVKYRVIDCIRSAQIQRRHLTASRGALSEADHSTEDHVAAADLTQALASGVEELPARTREVFQLSRAEHRSVPEIADRLHLSPKAVEYHLTKALKLLRGKLRDFLPLVLAGLLSALAVAW